MINKWRFFTVLDNTIARVWAGAKLMLSISTTATAPLMVNSAGLQRAIAQLPLSYRVIIQLHDVCGWETEEIAERLGISSIMVRQQIHKARLDLRQLLRGQPLSSALTYNLRIA
ncbi:MAG: sigma-70 region 4 domain-containing protein [Acidobacteriota bacterium]